MLTNVILIRYRIIHRTTNFSLAIISEKVDARSERSKRRVYYYSKKNNFFTEIC